MYHIQLIIHTRDETLVALLLMKHIVPKCTLQKPPYKNMHNI